METATEPPPLKENNAQAVPARKKRAFGQNGRTRRVLVGAALVLAGVLLGGAGARMLPSSISKVLQRGESGETLKPGPWGKIYREEFAIAAPEEMLPVRRIEAAGTVWTLHDFTYLQLGALLDSAGISADQRPNWFGPNVARITDTGVELCPTPEMLMALPPKAIEALYRQLAQFPENRSALYFIHKSTIDFRFADSGVPKSTIDLFNRLSCPSGEYVIFGALPAVLSAIPKYEDKVNFMRALTRQRTMMLALHVDSQSDIDKLTAYWGKGPWKPSVRALLESIQRKGDSTAVSIEKILPPLPAGELYFYPLSHDNPASSLSISRDCHWTSLNFFSEAPDPNTANGDLISRQLLTNYNPITGDPTYGDILVLANPSGEVMHSAVFIADDIVFTKNGSGPVNPWIFSTVSDLQKQYAFLAPEGQQLTQRYLRRKDM